MQTLHGDSVCIFVPSKKAATVPPWKVLAWPPKRVVKQRPFVLQRRHKLLARKKRRFKRKCFMWPVLDSHSKKLSTWREISGSFDHSASTALWGAIRIWGVPKSSQFSGREDIILASGISMNKHMVREINDQRYLGKEMFQKRRVCLLSTLFCGINATIITSQDFIKSFKRFPSTSEYCFSLQTRFPFPPKK